MAPRKNKSSSHLEDLVIRGKASNAILGDSSSIPPVKVMKPWKKKKNKGKKKEKKEEDNKEEKKKLQEELSVEKLRAEIIRHQGILERELESVRWRREKLDRLRKEVAEMDAEAVDTDEDD